ncbi:TPA: hypothetical protein IAD41_09220 [Candidatus Scatenecus faecavium]|uniref:Glycoside hydrolase family 38 central domain-containing protein n=1 Tax=Candidatus Scatenecus faecavium TaxID=2840915 RepID=A0A9D1K540_9BACT|nr:hypothetical protein [Candidatus Scatenecus faecavium]
MKKQVIAYLHTHWDREWYREFEVFRLRLLRVFDNVLEMLGSGKIPSFYFDGQVSAILDYLEIRPEKEQIVRQFIKEKKLFIGPFYCLIDEFLTDRTVFAKNIEIGMKIAKDFGCEDFIGYFADTFGHSKNIPPILQKYGIDKIMVWRGVPDLPSEFVFNGVNTINLVRGYFMDIFSSPKTIEEKAEWLKGNLDKIAQKSNDYILLPIGADHLGVEPDIAEQIEAVNAILANPADGGDIYEIKLSNPFEYFELVKDNFKTEWNDELRDNSKTFILPGCYSARMRLKQYRAEASYRLEQADRLQKHFGGNYSAIVEYAYKLLIQNHAHDSICGCSTDAVHFENYSRYEKILQIANTIIEELKLNNNEAFELVKKSGYEFKSTEKLEGFNIIRQEGGFEDRILYDTQKIPVTEDYTQIYTLQKRQTPQNEVQMEIREKELKINNIGIQFVRYQDNGDTYNYGPGAADMGEFATILEVIRYDETDSFLIRTDFFNVFLTRTENLINFRFEWNNQIKDCIWQVKFDLPNPVCKTFSEDMNMIIERDFDPNYNMRQHLPKERGIEAKTNFAPMQRYVGAQGFGIVTKGLTEYEVFKNSISITLLRSTGVISNPKNSARSTPAGPPLEVPGAQQLGFNRAELSIGFFEPEDYLKYVHEVYPQIV